MVTIDRETKVISVILIAAFLSLVGAKYFDSIYFVDWYDIERIVEYSNEAVLGDTVHIRYYVVNSRPHEIKVGRLENKRGIYFQRGINFRLTTFYASNPDERITVPIDMGEPGKRYTTVPAKSTVEVHTETVTATQVGTLYVQVTGLPEVRIDVVPEYSYEMKLKSEPHLVRGGNCYYTIDITMLNNGVSDINVRLENVRICDIAYYNTTVDERGYDIVPDNAGYVLVPVNGTQSIRYVTGEVVHGSIFYVRIEFTLHIRELDKMERISTWLHRKAVTS